MRLTKRHSGHKLGFDLFKFGKVGHKSHHNTNKNSTKQSRKMKPRKQLTYLGILFLMVSNLCSAQELEQQFQHLLDSTYQANPDAVGIMIHVESPDNNISRTSAVGYSNKDTKQKIDKDQPDYLN